ncbi:MAG: NUDIX domain-containing protein [Candidatus Woesearchaeota archaeon]|nr:NUDIX domain-containing protein [Candidatus Woesearchaeota archaeon]
MGEIPKISVAVDITVFTIINNDLKVLLIRRKNEPFRGMYALPGGFVELNESLEKAAARELEEETNVRGIFLKQLHAWGDVKRDPRGRVISVSFMALIDSDKFKLLSTSDAEAAAWISVYEIPKLAFDHKTVLDDALSELRYEIQTTNITLQLLPKEFTLTDLQRTYEVILDTKLDKRNFRKRIKALEIIRETGKEKMEGAHRPAKTYIFKDQKYAPIREKMHVFLK